MNLRCVVVDDSSIQRLSIVKMINEHPALILLAEYKNALETKKGIKDLEVDLIFLDIEMPVINGFELLDLLTNKPQIIFITGKTEYAMKAFDYDATDYLHKPITIKRFNTAVNKALEHYNLHNNGKSDDFIFVKSNLKKIKINIHSILWIEAFGDYVKIVTTDDNPIIVLSTMKSFLNQLADFHFFRIHKSYIINLIKVTGFNAKTVEINNEYLPLSRNKKASLIEALDNI